MVTLRYSVVGREVFDKVRGLTGTVVREDGLSLVILFILPDGSSEKKIVTPGIFRTNYRLTENRHTLADLFYAPKFEQDRVNTRTIQGEKGIGPYLWNEFNQILKLYANQNLDIHVSKDSRHVTIIYNSKVAFRVVVSSRRLTVTCNIKALSPISRKFCYVKNEHNATMATYGMFVFTKRSDSPVMRAVIVDGLFYCQIIDELKE